MVLVSIVGDSISTFEGYNPPGYAVFYNKEMQVRNGLKNVYDTWWAKVNQSLHAFLCVNNSYSGSKVTGNAFPASSCIERISNLCRDHYLPDIILIYMGVNDFGNGIRIKRNLPGLFHKYDLSVFEDAYGFMIDRIKECYPKANVICGTLLRSSIKNDDNWQFPESIAGVPFDDYNDAIRRSAKKKDVFLADVGASESRYETLDGTHPTAEGHETIAEVWISKLIEFDFIKPTIETCIRMYSANKNMDFAIYAVFEALSREKVLMAFDNNNNLVGLPYKDDTLIPVFTSPLEISEREPVKVRPVLLRDNIETLLSLKKHLIVNPFSEPDIQFMIPYEAIKKMLKPVIENNC